MDFLDIISKFTGHTRDKIGVYVIHLENSVERLPLMEKFNNDLKVTPEIIFPENGEELIARGHPVVNKSSGKQNAGVISCTRSHVRACENALKNGKEYCVIFEDDIYMKGNFNTFVNSLMACKSIFHTYAIKWDIFLLGALGYSSHLPNPHGVSSIYNFDGTHALLFNKKVMYEYISSYYKGLENNYIEPADGLYCSLIRDRCICIGFTDAKLFFDQKQDGMWSYVGNCIK
jgi:GR25 family glycosyltransferase involved in LPS biosynthesis